MLAFYIDETLAETEEAEVLTALAAKEIDRIEYRRIACVFPAAGEKVTTEKMIGALKGHLRHAHVPIGSQSVFIVPKEGIRWAVLLQEAFYLVSGFYPLMVQPWEVQLTDAGEIPVRREHLRMIDMHAVMGG